MKRFLSKLDVRISQRALAGLGQAEAKQRGFECTVMARRRYTFTSASSASSSSSSTGKMEGLSSTYMCYTYTVQHHQIQDFLED